MSPSVTSGCLTDCHDVQNSNMSCSPRILPDGEILTPISASSIRTPPFESTWRSEDSPCWSPGYAELINNDLLNTPEASSCLSSSAHSYRKLLSMMPAIAAEDLQRFVFHKKMLRIQHTEAGAGSPRSLGSHVRELGLLVSSHLADGDLPLHTEARAVAEAPCHLQAPQGICSSQPMDTHHTLTSNSPPNRIPNESPDIAGLSQSPYTALGSLLYSRTRPRAASLPSYSRPTVNSPVSRFSQDLRNTTEFVKTLRSSHNGYVDRYCNNNGVGLSKHALDAKLDAVPPEPSNEQGRLGFGGELVKLVRFIRGQLKYSMTSFTDISKTDSLSRIASQAGSGPELVSSLALLEGHAIQSNQSDSIHNDLASEFLCYIRESIELRRRVDVMQRLLSQHAVSASLAEPASVNRVSD
eukprot:GILJ01003976.1.p1 GENE.GILJ01003976.1~~GILJ01003976.1.p1  ORF type:complete len:411 (-),score=54.46 GILJ01003976.1:33-1265(-)